jgi:hypothetical protein
MTNARRFRAVSWSGLWLAAALAAGCSSGSSKLTSTPQCVLASDCTTPLVCALQYCVKQCAESRDCPSGERCIKVANGTICQPPETKMCQFNSQCTPLVCGRDLQCRSACQADVDCPTGQKCTSMSMVCVDPVLDQATYDPVTNELRPPNDGGVDAATDAPVGTGGGNGNDGGAGGATGSDGGPKDRGVDMGVDLGPPSCDPGLAGFHASNLPQPFTLPAGASAASIDNNAFAADTIDTDMMTISNSSAVDAAVPVTAVVTLSDGREAAAFYFSSFTLTSGSTLNLLGSRPLIIAADGPIEIDGTITTTEFNSNGSSFGGGAASPNRAGGGGQSPVDTANGGGQGGAAVQDTQPRGAGGGAFCGPGGQGSLPVGSDAGTPSMGGTPYGPPELVPLMGGSSGGATDFFSDSNHGGGAIELVSGASVTIGSNGVINMGGGRGNYAMGGGSGGGILLEAPTVTVRGVVAANGGGGGTRNYGGGTQQDGQPNNLPAHGGGYNGTSGAGGLGSAGPMINGTNGIPTTNDYSGGGGGAGRIRINIGCGGMLNLNSSGLFTPDQTTTCYSTGMLK